MIRIGKFKKIEGVKEIKKYGLPMAETIFIFNFEKQEKEIDAFLKSKKIVTIRSDKSGGADFCPCWLGCPKNKAKPIIKQLIGKGYAVLLQKYVPIMKEIFSGNTLILKKHILMELMKEGPLVWLNRDGLVEEQIKFRKRDLKEMKHFGKRITKKKDLNKVLKMINHLPSFKIVEFTLRPEGLYFWQMRDDKTAKRLKD